MHVVVVYANKEDKIELTKKELEKMLDDGCSGSMRFQCQNEQNFGFGGLFRTIA